ncbi:hypothetical protein CLF_109264 [Clonorchis sinensis]|uniref:Uncharacterized protein n=1 Tax=Clonorchis sinensis TaxID=79923 RepID=G7YSF4_CLOSI|nr:hypothetical protein CLF_109264 [Clonorchis sinensis]
MKRPGVAHSVAWKHQKREIQLGSSHSAARPLVAGRFCSNYQLGGRGFMTPRNYFRCAPLIALTKNETVVRSFPAPEDDVFRPITEAWPKMMSVHACQKSATDNDEYCTDVNRTAWIQGRKCALSSAMLILVEEQINTFIRKVRFLKATTECPKSTETLSSVDVDQTDNAPSIYSVSQLSIKHRQRESALLKRCLSASVLRDETEGSEIHTLFGHTHSLRRLPPHAKRIFSDIRRTNDGHLSQFFCKIAYLSISNLIRVSNRFVVYNQAGKPVSNFTVHYREQVKESKRETTDTSDANSTTHQEYLEEFLKTCLFEVNGGQQGDSFGRSETHQRSKGAFLNWGRPYLFASRNNQIGDDVRMNNARLLKAHKMCLTGCTMEEFVRGTKISPVYSVNNYLICGFHLLNTATIRSRSDGNHAVRQSSNHFKLRILALEARSWTVHLRRSIRN